MNAFAKKVESVLLDARWLAWTLVFFAITAWIASAILLARGVTVLTVGQSVMIALAAAACFAVVVFVINRQMPRVGALARLPIEGNHGLMLVIVVGLVLRLMWIVAFDAQPSSDGLTYLELAKKIVGGQAYRIAGTSAFWPPGYAFFLGGFMRTLTPALAVPVSQLLLFCVGSVGLYRLTARFSSTRAALIAVGLFCVWPNLVAHTATPEKELLVATLLIWAVLGATGVRTASVFIGGVLLGATTLVQPSTLLLIPAMAALLLIRRSTRALLPIAVLLLGAALVITPWTVRNYQVLGAFKLVSTNGGGNFYRANNSLADGGYTPAAEVDLSHLSELDGDRVAKELAVRWIKEHPAAFLGLLIEKEVRFMGDDAGGVYATFRAQKEDRHQLLYFGLKMVSNAWWVLMWASIAALVIAGARLGKASFLAWGWIYLFALHSVFESSGKYHVPVLWIPCLMLGILLADAERKWHGVPVRHSAGNTDGQFVKGAAQSRAA